MRWRFGSCFALVVAACGPFHRNAHEGAVFVEAPMLADASAAALPAPLPEAPHVTLGRAREVSRQDDTSRNTSPLREAAPPPRSEPEILEDIRTALTASRRLSPGARRATVSAMGAKVTLRGRVKSVEERAVLEAVARATEGVDDVDNQLELRR